MKDKTVNQAYPRILQWSVHDVIQNEEIVRDIRSKMVYVSDYSELAHFTDEPIGTFAATYGLTALYQLKPDRTWATIFEP